MLKQFENHATITYVCRQAISRDSLEGKSFIACNIKSKTQNKTEITIHSEHKQNNAWGTSYKNINKHESSEKDRDIY